LLWEREVSIMMGDEALEEVVGNLKFLESYKTSVVDCAEDIKIRKGRQNKRLLNSKPARKNLFKSN